MKKNKHDIIQRQFDELEQRSEELRSLISDICDSSDDTTQLLVEKVDNFDFQNGKVVNTGKVKNFDL